MKKLVLIAFVCLIFNSAFGQKDSIIYINDYLTIYKTQALYNGIEIYNSEKEAFDYKKLKEDKESDCKVVVDIYRNPLSLVGNLFSFEYYFGSEEGCGYYGNTICVEMINLKTLKKIRLTDLFTEESILEALKNDSWVKKQFINSSVQLNSIKSFNKMLAILSSHNEFKPNSFTIVDKEIKNGKIGIRFVGSQSIGHYHQKHLQLGLWLVPKKAFKKRFLSETKFVLGDFKNGLTN